LCLAIKDSIEEKNIDPVDSVHSNLNESFKFKTINLNYLNEIIKNLKNKSGPPDYISVKIIKDFFESIGEILLDIIINA
jgi:hypothetical protein